MPAVDDLFDRIDVRLDRLEAGQGQLAVSIRELRNQMLVLHADLVDRIKAIADPTEALRREMVAGDEARRH